MKILTTYEATSHEAVVRFRAMVTALIAMQVDAARSIVPGINAGTTNILLDLLGAAAVLADYIGDDLEIADDRNDGR